MIYPKFPRRTLALILFCLLLTLGAVGILFLVYFFNESSILFMDSPRKIKGAYGNQLQSQHYRQTLVGTSEYNNAQKSSNQHIKNVDKPLNQIDVDSKRSTVFQYFEDDSPIFSTSSQEILPKLRDQVLLKKNNNAQDSIQRSSNLDTIYIDDFDRLNFKSKENSEVSNIDYFDTILVDHNMENSNIKNSNSYVRNSFQASKIDLKNFKENNNHSKINSKRLDQKGLRTNLNLLKYTKVRQNLQNDDDIYDLEIDDFGSGSGDYLDDIEIKEIIMRQVNADKTKRKRTNKSVTKSKSKNSYFLKKNGNYYLSNKKTKVSLSPFLTTASSKYLENDRSFNNWIKKKTSKHLTASSTQTTGQLHSPSIKLSSYILKPTNNSWSTPMLAFSSQQTLINESNNESEQSTYNNNIQSHWELDEAKPTSSLKGVNNFVTHLRQNGGSDNSETWIETRTRRIMGNVKKSEERSRQLLLCEEAGGGELCRMLFKGRIND